jgi:hypothetical protein
MKLKILTVPKQQEPTLEERTISTLFKSIAVCIVLSFTASLFNFLSWRKVFKKLPWKLHFREFEEMRMLHIHSSNGQMTSFDHCYCDRARLPVTQSSSGHRDVVGPLLLGIRIITP